MSNSSTRKAFADLCDLYKSITKKDLPKHNPYPIFRDRTGFGSWDTCSLCKAAHQCSECFWVKTTGVMCCRGLNRETYLDIVRANTRASLLRAIKARARRMKKLLKNNK